MGNFVVDLNLSKRVLPPDLVIVILIIKKIKEINKMPKDEIYHRSICKGKTQTTCSFVVRYTTHMILQNGAWSISSI